MAEFTYTDIESGSYSAFFNPKFWIPSGVPGADDEAILPTGDDAAEPYISVVGANETVAGVMTGAGAILEIGYETEYAGMSFTVSNGGTNAGEIWLDGANTNFTFGGTLDSTGAIKLDSVGSDAWLQISAANATLAGAGVVQLSANSDNRIVGTLSGSTGDWRVSTLANANTIVGVGAIGADLSLSNSGVIDAVGPDGASLAVETGYSGAAGSNTIANTGVLEATNPDGLATTGGLALSHVVIVDAPGEGVIAAIGPDTHVDLASTTISGGNLETSDGGVIDTADAGSILEGINHTVFVQGDVVVTNGTGLTLEGAIANYGTIRIAAAGVATTLTIGVQTVLAGGGTVSLGDSAHSEILEGSGGAMAASLTNLDNTIVGAGTIGADLTNESAGVIDASGANPLVLAPESGTFTNDGLLEVTGSGGLVLEGAVTGPGSASIAAGTLDARGAFSQNVAFTTGAGGLELADAGGYAGSVSGFSSTGGTSLDFGDIGFVSPSQASFSGDAGSGVLTVTDGTHTAKIALSGNYLDTDFTSASDGHSGTLIIGSTADHWLNTAGGDFATSASWSAGEAPGADSDAILDATASTSYDVDATQNETVRSLQLGPQAQLYISAPFTTLDGTGGGAIAGTIWVDNGATLTLNGTVDIGNIIYDNGGASATTVLIGAGGVSLTGGFSFAAANASAGSLVLDFFGGKYQRIIGATASTVLTNVDDRISGQGSLGCGRLIIDNEAQGFIEAKGGPLVIDTGVQTIVNAGLIDAEGAPSELGAPGKGLVISPVDNTGILKADGLGSSLIFEDAVTGAPSLKGRGEIAQGILEFDSSFNQNVGFTRPNGELILAQSQGYSSRISGFFSDGTTSIDLRDIGFVGAGEATYSGTSQEGVLTVTDGIRTSHITFAGDYLGTTFIAKSDGHGGTLITDRTTSSRVSAHAFAAAAAALVATAAHARPAPFDSGEDRRGLLALPGTHGTEP